MENDNYVIKFSPTNDTIEKLAGKIDDVELFKEKITKVNQLIERYWYYTFYINKPKYKLFPNKKKKGYNSNSYARGLLKAVKMDAPKTGYSLPGMKKPLPKHYFGV